MIAPVLTRKVIHPLRSYLSSYQRQVSGLEIELEKSQWLSTDSLRDLQQESLRTLCDEANQNSTYYSKIFRERGIDASRITLENLIELPILDRQTIKENYADIANSSLDVSALIERSSGGSTGEPVHVLRTLRSFIVGQAVKRRNYRWVGWRPGDRHHWFWGAYLDAPRETLKERLRALLYNQRFVNAFSVSEDLFESYYLEASRSKPYLLESYSNILYEFARFIEQSGRQPLGIPAIISSAGKLFEFQREVIERTIGANIFDRYGCRELDTIAHECEAHSGLHINMERFIVEVESPDADGFGDIIVTDLANIGFPIIRYRIQDRGRFSDQQCACGRGLVMLSELEGRDVDVVRTPSGKIISGALFPQLFIRHPNVILGQVVQHKIDELEVLLRVDSAPSKEMLSTLETDIRSYTGPEVRITISVVDELISNPTKKYRFVISKI